MEIDLLGVGSIDVRNNIPEGEEGYLYRYHDRWDGGEIVISLDKFRIARETPKGVWIHKYQFSADKEDEKFVLGGSGKRFAYPTEEEARYSFMRRKRAQIDILTAQMRKAVAARDWALGEPK